MAADVTATLTTGAVAGALGPVSALRPPEEVIVYAMLGAVVAVWLDSRTTDTLSWDVIWRATMVAFVSVLSGVVGSALILHWGDVPVLGVMAKAERWVSAFIIAALIHRAGPYLKRLAEARARREEGKPDANIP